jgi:predicted ATP-grasp superfamily ATP-dependent carboligase
LLNDRFQDNYHSYSDKYVFLEMVVVGKGWRTLAPETTTPSYAGSGSDVTTAFYDTDDLPGNISIPLVVLRPVFNSMVCSLV